MKTLFTSLLHLFLLPLHLFAQSISTNEFYHIGQSFSMVNCDASTVTVGSPGPSMTWNFSSVGAATGSETTTVLQDTNAAFPTSTIKIVNPDGTVWYEQENNTDSYLNGVWDSTRGGWFYYTNYDIAKRPITYNTTAQYGLYNIDTYYVAEPATSLNGRGVMQQTCDAYGTLILPTGTFTNVLRVKKVVNETDTVGTVPQSGFSKITYMWFDSLHAAPLFELDSSIGLTMNTQTAKYLVTPSAVANVVSQQGNFKGYLGNNTMIITGDFVSGQAYTIDLYNLIGSKIFTVQFTATGNTQQFEIGSQVSPGIYIVSITPKSETASPSVLKLVKQ